MRYWPKEHETKELQVPGGKMFVKTIRETSHAEFVVREFEVTTKTNGKVINCFFSSKSQLSKENFCWLFFFFFLQENTFVLEVIYYSKESISFVSFSIVIGTGNVIQHFEKKKKKKN